MSAIFDLTQNPFHLLGLSIRARQDEVVEAYEEALANGRTEEGVLTGALQRVWNPVPRTYAELSWLPSVPPSQAKEIVSNLEGPNIASAHRALECLQGLDKANLAADLCVRSGGEINYVDKLLKSYEDFTAQDVMEILKGLRSISGFRNPNQQQVKKALIDLRDEHAQAAFHCIDFAKNPWEAMKEIVETFLRRLRRGSVRRPPDAQLLYEIVKKYDVGSLRYLDWIEKNIKDAIATYGDGGNHIPVARLVELLDEWDVINQPVQLIDDSKGHEEPRSKEICQIIRGFYRRLAEKHGHYREALAICRALLETFPELRAVADQLSQDVVELESLAEEARTKELLGLLIDSQEAIRAKISDFGIDICTSGFGPDSHGLAKRLYDAFADAAARTAGTELADTPWMVVRGLAIDLNNKDNSPEGASSILEGLISHKGTAPSKEVFDKLKDDQRALRRNLKWEKLQRISGDFPKGISLVSELLDGADAEERSALLQIQTALKRKRAVTVGKWLFWGLAVTALAGFLIYEVNKPSYSPRRSAKTAFAPSDMPASVSPSLSASSQLREQMPLPDTDRVFGTREVRYCTFQGVRLDILRDLVSGKREIDRFDDRFADFNSRCTNFRARSGVVQAIQAEVPGESQKLRLDVQHLISWWREPSFLLDITTVSGAMLVQRKLKELGHYVSVVDGLWGPASREALKSFKLSQSGLRHDDRWDLATQTALMGR